MLYSIQNFYSRTQLNAYSYCQDQRAVTRPEMKPRLVFSWPQKLPEGHLSLTHLVQQPMWAGHLKGVWAQARSHWESSDNFCLSEAASHGGIHSPFLKLKMQVGGNHSTLPQRGHSIGLGFLILVVSCLEHGCKHLSKSSTEPASKTHLWCKKAFWD